MHTQLDIKKWGNGLGVRVPKTIAEQVNFTENQRVDLAVENGCLIVAPLGEKTLTLEERLKKFNKNQHQEVMQVDEFLGAEKW
jgi:antitoxin MazE